MQRLCFCQKRKNKNLTLPDLVVLSLLSEKPMHGYYIVNQLEVRDAKDWAPVSRPQVYYSLKKLLGMKLIYNDSNGESSLGPERVQYHIGKTGEEALNHALSSEKWASQRSPSPFMTWMGLSSNLSKKTTRRLIALRKSFLEKELECKIEIENADTTKNDPAKKARNALPLKPAIYVE